MSPDRADAYNEAPTAEVEIIWRNGTLVLMAISALLLPIATLFDAGAIRLPLEALAAGLLGWFTVTAAITWTCGLEGVTVDIPEIMGDFNAMTPILLDVEVSRSGTHWPALFVTLVLETQDVTGRSLPSPPVFVARISRDRFVTCRWRITVRTRGEFLVQQARITSAFPGSPFSMQSVVVIDRSLMVQPAIYHLDPQRTLELLRGRRGDSARIIVASHQAEEFVGVRYYRPGDNPRAVHPVLSYRAPDYPLQLVMREFEDAGSDDVCVLLDNVLNGDEKNDITLRYRYEVAVCFTLALCKLLVERKYRVRFGTVSAVGAYFSLPIHHAVSDLAALARCLTRLSPVVDDELFVDKARDELAAVTSVALLVSLRDTLVERRNPRLPVLTISPDMQRGLTREVAGQ